jgi:hypothetical protein
MFSLMLLMTFVEIPNVLSDMQQWREQHFHMRCEVVFESSPGEWLM